MTQASEKWSFSNIGQGGQGSLFYTHSEENLEVMRGKEVDREKVKQEIGNSPVHRDHPGPRCDLPRAVRGVVHVNLGSIPPWLIDFAKAPTRGLLPWLPDHEVIRSAATDLGIRFGWDWMGTVRDRFDHFAVVLPDDDFRRGAIALRQFGRRLGLRPRLTVLAQTEVPVGVLLHPQASRTHRGWLPIKPGMRHADFEQWLLSQMAAGEEIDPPRQSLPPGKPFEFWRVGRHRFPIYRRLPAWVSHRCKLFGFGKPRPSPTRSEIVRHAVDQVLPEASRSSWWDHVGTIVAGDLHHLLSEPYARPYRKHDGRRSVEAFAAALELRAFESPGPGIHHRECIRVILPHPQATDDQVRRLGDLQPITSIRS